ncbi:hypothetical protein VCHENC02_3869B, partial [Vibrio harveyi]
VILSVKPRSFIFCSA